MTAVTLADLTSGSLTSDGVFDKLMASNKAHLEAEYAKNRITGADYSTVYLGMLQQTMQTAVAFLTEQQLIGLKADLLAQQIENETKQGLLLEKQALKMDKDIDLVQSQIDLNGKDLILKQIQIDRAPKELELLQSQIDISLKEVEIKQAQLELAEAELLVKNRELDLMAEQIQLAQKDVELKQTQIDRAPKELELLTAQVSLTTKQGDLVDGQVAKLEVERDIALQEVQKTTQETKVLVAQECKLKAEFDLTMGNVTKTTKETELLAQKVTTEKAQTMELGVDENSVIGRQKALYRAQTDGFARDAEQKVAKALMDTWNARRMTDEGTSANTTNKLDDPTIGRAVTKMLTGINA